MLQRDVAGKQLMSSFSSLSLKVTTFFGILKMVIEHPTASKQTLRAERVLWKNCRNRGR
jgi:hypothetical protein